MAPSMKTGAQKAAQLAEAMFLARRDIIKPD
jgi:hypothetical protein